MQNEKELSPLESLQIIQSMINKTKDTVAADSFYFLLWGWLTFICCIAAYILKVYLQFPYHYYVWFLMPVGGIISGIYGSRQSKKEKIKTFVGEAISYLWIALAFSFILLVIINALTNAWQTAFTYYILLYAIGTFVTGNLLRFKPLVIGGIINFILVAVSVKFGYDLQLLIGGLAILCSYIIPGYLLKAQYQKQTI
jgi:hypothetical protein